MTDTATRSQPSTIPAPSGFSHVSLPARDLAQSKRFFTEVLGGHLVADGPVPRLRLGDFTIDLGQQDGGATRPHSEHPHYAFTVGPDTFVDLKRRLQTYGVPTHEPWTRTGSSCALMYFCDPAGNRFELFCDSGFNALPLRIGARAGGDYAIDFPALRYDALKSPTTSPPKVRAADFNHMTLPVRDLPEAKRFWMEVFGGTLTVNNPSHATVVVGGAEVGNAPLDGGWTAPDAEYPHYTFLVEPDDLLPLKEHLDSYGVPTAEVCTRNGTDASMYFRDPSGNLWELYCPSGFTGATRRTPTAGGDFVVDLKALNYDTWKDPGR
jgi:catechol 2,3-dioxygenase-like lactoylglutathione lyase family enzyme